MFWRSGFVFFVVKVDIVWLGFVCWLILYKEYWKSVRVSLWLVEGVKIFVDLFLNVL